MRSGGAAGDHRSCGRETTRLKEELLMNNSFVDKGARKAAEVLSGQFDPTLVMDVERELRSREGSHPPDQYIDPASLASLIVSVATLAWTVFQDLKKKTPSPAPTVIARAVRVQVRASSELAPSQRDRIIDVVVEETVKAASAGD
jgi:hypothetical protein